MASPPPLHSREDLLNLYGKALDEYRFQVRLNWDRTQYFLVLNLAVIAAATGLLKLGAAEPLKYTVALLFWGGMIMAALGVRVIRRGHNYYRATRYQKAALEGLLYLLTPTEVPPGRSIPLSIATTVAMREGYGLLAQRAQWDEDAPLSAGSINLQVVRVLIVLAGLDGIAAVIACL